MRVFAYGVEPLRMAISTCTVGLLVLLFLASVAQADLMSLQRVTETMAGINLNSDPSGNNLYVPTGLCGFEADSDLTITGFHIGTAISFRDYVLDTRGVSTWFGGNAVEGKGANTNGPILKALVSNPYACVTVRSSSTSTGAYIVFYVTGDGAVRWVKGGVVGSINLTNPTGNSFLALATYRDDLYVLSQQNKLYKCSIFRTADTPLGGCKQVSTRGGVWASLAMSQRGIAVNSGGIFIASGKGLNWFNANGGLLGSIVNVPFMDVRFFNDLLFASSSTALYRINISTSAMTHSILSGKEAKKGICKATSGNNRDGTNPLYCGIYRIYPLSEDVVYMTMSSAYTLRALLLPDVNVTISLPRNPFPIGFNNQDEIMSELYALMKDELNDKLGTSGVFVGAGTGQVYEPSWNTSFVVKVPQRQFDNDTTAVSIQDVTFPKTNVALQRYYNRTDENVYGDRNILPMCNVEKMHNIENEVAYRAREAIGYSLIYTNPAKELTINGNPNITLIKLLMPAALGTAQTHDLLSKLNFSTILLRAVQSNYDSNHTYNLRFLEDEYHFDKLNEEQITELRWMIQQIIQKQLEKCKKEFGELPGGGSGSGSGNGSGNGNGELVPNCTSTVGITNVTRARNTLDDNTYQIFVPDEMNYTFNISSCLEKTDWKEVIDWIDTRPVHEHKSKCGTNCIVGVAVAAAVVVTIILVVIVVLVSKRRRLATVVVPAAAAPKFSSTVDLDDEEEYNRNPLA